MGLNIVCNAPKLISIQNTKIASKIIPNQKSVFFLVY